MTTAMTIAMIISMATSPKTAEYEIYLVFEITKFFLG